MPHKKKILECHNLEASSESSTYRNPINHFIYIVYLNHLFWSIHLRHHHSFCSYFPSLFLLTSNIKFMYYLLQFLFNSLQSAHVNFVPFVYYVIFTVLHLYVMVSDSPTHDSFACCHVVFIPYSLG